MSDDIAAPLGPLGESQDAFEAAAARVRARYPTDPGLSQNLMQAADIAGNVGLGMATAGPRMVQQAFESGVAGTPMTTEQMVPGAMDTAMSVTGSGASGAMRGAAGLSGGKLVQPKLFTKSGDPIKGRAFSKRSREVKEAIGKGEGPLDVTGDLRMDVEQKALPRINPPRGVSPEMQDALNNPDVIKGVSESIEAGMQGGMHRWYHNKPIYDAFVNELGEKKGPIAFKKYMDMTSATSPGSDVPTNIRNASYYYQLAQQEKRPPKKIPYPYGHKYHNLHRQNFADVQAGGYDVLKNPKPPSYGENLAGNLQPGAMDTHAFRNVAMRTRDQRFLATSSQDKIPKGKSPSPRQRELGEISVDKDGNTIVVYRPQQLFAEGRLTMDEAVKMPTMWRSQPKPNEYAAIEQLYARLGEHYGLAPAEAQSAAWAGAGELTGLGTPGDKIFAEMFNERVEYTARMRNEKPSITLRKMIRGQAPLLSTGGATAIGASQPMRDLLGGGDDINQLVGAEPDTQAKRNREQIERSRTYDQNRPVKAYDPSMPIRPGTPVTDPSTGKTGPAI